MGFSVNQRNSLRSPHVLGKDTRRQRDDSVRGITPACAGKRKACLHKAHCKKDHPRVCGEKYCYGAGYDREVGSPPRVRGKGRFQLQRFTRCRITPACAGKSKRIKPTGRSARDHPRVCGEKHIRDCHAPCVKGSPPRVRGKGKPALAVVCHDRITPACAGKSLYLGHEGLL